MYSGESADKNMLGKKGRGRKCLIFLDMKEEYLNKLLV